MQSGEVANIILGTVILSIGLAACLMALIRGRRGVRVLFWYGLWSGMYGAQLLSVTPAVRAALPRALQVCVPYFDKLVTYLLLVAALMMWRELTTGKLRFLIGLEAIAALAVAIVGIVAFFVTGNDARLKSLNNLVAVIALLVLCTAVLVPKLGRRYFVLPDNLILSAGTLFFALEALYTNALNVLQIPAYPVLDAIAFAVLLLSLGYVALKMVFQNEHRLLAIETELETAREIQASILPANIPELARLRIAASYEPMTSVAGDFYGFLARDSHRIGVLVADVTGHGVPAALISSMIKVAMQSVAGSAQDPGEVLGGLNRILSSELRGQLVSAAYLWIDTESNTARFSAAGHPPLLWWHNASGELQPIESNGLLFGVRSNGEYPVCDFPIQAGDRLLLYTDGVVEPENALGEAFGDRQLGQVIRANRERPAAELSEALLVDLRKWPPPSIGPQDDITLIVIDVV